MPPVPLLAAAAVGGGRGGVVPPVVEYVLRSAGPILFLGLQCSSIKTAASFHKLKSTGSLSGVPFVSLFTNCLIWTLYGYMQRDMTIMLPNASGTLVAVFCISSYHRFAPATSRPTNLYFLSSFISLAALVLALLGHAPVLGLIGCTLSVLLSASPLAALSAVVREKSTQSMPFLSSLILWINSVSWLSYGLVVSHDAMVWGPNALNFVITTAQMALYLLYPSTKAKKNDEVLGSTDRASDAVVGV